MGESTEGSGLRMPVILNPSSLWSLHGRPVNARDEVLRPGRDYLESQLTEKMVG